jgi:hypothetical protein
MWNKGFRILWIRIQFDIDKHFGLPFPIPMHIFQELLDSTLDLLTVVCLFVPGTPKNISSPSFTVYAVKEVIETTMKLLDSLTQDEPYDLVDVTADKVRVFIKIR